MKKVLAVSIALNAAFVVLALLCWSCTSYPQGEVVGPDGERTTVVFSNPKVNVFEVGGRLWFKGEDYGEVRKGDTAQVTKDGRLFIEGERRFPNSFPRQVRQQ
ncbi:MAG: hypothetical protein HY717_13565 [Planctomycetes bacterium]|nr:hypothetical protein [Planctomycetota bacterium]